MNVRNVIYIEILLTYGCILDWLSARSRRSHSNDRERVWRTHALGVVRDEYRLRVRRLNVLTRATSNAEMLVKKSTTKIPLFVHK